MMVAVEPEQAHAVRNRASPRGNGEDHDVDSPPGHLVNRGEAVPCSTSDGDCPGYATGHHLHWIPARHIGQAPRGWRDAIVESVDEDGWAVIHYAAEDARVRVWHHRRPPTGPVPGSPVRLHERYNALDCQYGWLNVAFTGGLGPVPAPEHPELWTRE